MKLIMSVIILSLRLCSLRAFSLRLRFLPPDPSLEHFLAQRLTALNPQQENSCVELLSLRLRSLRAFSLRLGFLPPAPSLEHFPRTAVHRSNPQEAAHSPHPRARNMHYIFATAEALPPPGHNVRSVEDNEPVVSHPGKPGS